MFSIRFLSAAIASAMLLAIAPVAPAQGASSDPPDRVVRLAFQTGDVEYAPSGEDQWAYASVNRPLTTGDRLDTGPDGRAALELGGASVRINRNSAFSVLDLDSDTAQFELTQGGLNLRVRRMEAGQTYEVDTPTLAFVANQPGNYRLDVTPNGIGTIVTVFSGDGVAYGQDGVSQPVSAGQSFRFYDAKFARVTESDIGQRDDFDHFSEERDARYERSISRRYVSADVIGYDDLDGYGDWSETSDYGAVWYPTRVARDWAPYHDGHWTWVDPWGWTWVDNAPWGFAPSHYGRWAYIGNRWGWIPGPPVQRAVYAPALVAFVGGSGLSVGIRIGGGGGEPVGWFPLGPRDVYRPPYQVTSNYITRVNVTNVKVVNNIVINNYINNRPGPPAVYGNRNVAGAVTVVPRNVFTGSRPVASAAIRITPEILAKATVSPTIRVAPSAQSIVSRPAPRPSIAPSAQQPAHPVVIARHAPPPPPPAFAERVKIIASQGGKPLAPAQLTEISKTHAGDQHAPAPHVVIASPTEAGSKRPTPVRVPAVNVPEAPAKAIASPPADTAKPGAAAAVRDQAHPPVRKPAGNAAATGQEPPASGTPQATGNPPRVGPAPVHGAVQEPASPPVRKPVVNQPATDQAPQKPPIRAPRANPVQSPSPATSKQQDRIDQGLPQQNAGAPQPIRNEPRRAPTPIPAASASGNPAQTDLSQPVRHQPVQQNKQAASPRVQGGPAATGQPQQQLIPPQTPAERAAQKKKDDKAKEDQLKKDQQDQPDQQH